MIGDLGRDLTAMKAKDRLTYRRDVVGFIWQKTSRNLLHHLDAADNVMLPMGYRGVRGRLAQRRAEELQVRRTVAIRDGRTSSEVLRRVDIDEHGLERHSAEEYVTLDRAGRMQLPREYIEVLGMRDRVRVSLEEDHVGVWAAHDEPEG